jgi:hypothetical protein
MMHNDTHTAKMQKKLIVKELEKYLLYLSSSSSRLCYIIKKPVYS